MSCALTYAIQGVSEKSVQTSGVTSTQENNT
jgi:hypothetical protein